MKFIILLTSLIVLGNISVTKAQYWEIGAMAGATTYHGDLAPDFSMQNPGLAINAFVRRNVDSRLSLRMGVSVGTISGSDSKSLNTYNIARNLSFNSTIFEGSIGMEFNFAPFHHHSRKGRNKNQFSPYLLTGFGILHHSPRAQYKGRSYALQSLGTEGQAPGQEYSLVQPAFIIGGGFKIDINSQWGIIIEAATRILFFDYLDDVSGTYANASLIAGHRGSMGNTAIQLADRSGEVGQNLGVAGRQRGDANTNDGYTMFSIGIVFTMHQTRCPAW